LNLMDNKVILVPLFVSLFLSAIRDIRFQKIPNWLTYPTMIVSIAYHSSFNGFRGLLFSIEGVCLGIALLILPYLFGGMGAGDVKLLGAVGGVLGPKGVFVAFLFTAIVGGIYALVLLAVNGYLKETINRYKTILMTFLLSKKFFYIPIPERKKSPRLCYGIAIAVGTLISLFGRSVIDSVF